MAGKQAKPRGRPRRYLGDRPNWTIRLEEKYGEQIRKIAERDGLSISAVCEQQIINSFRLQAICDLLERKNEALTKEIQDCRTAYKVATDLAQRAHATRSRFGRPQREKKR